MRALFFLIVLSGSLFASNTSAPERTDDNRLVWVHFALADDSRLKLPVGIPNIVHSDITLWISDKNRGDSVSYLNGPIGSGRGGSSPDTDTHGKWAQCLKLLKAIDQPKDLPSLSTRIVTVTCADGEANVIKKFSIEHVPAKTHQILTIMGFTEADFARLTFDQ